MATYGGLLWVKNRPITLDHYLVDTVRGFTKYFATNNTNAENTGDIQLVSTPYGVTFNTGSASLNQAAQGYTYVGWNWGAGGAAVTNTTGSISAQVSANPLSGFSIATYTGVSNGTVGHGLGVAPSMIIVKSRGSQNWFVYHTSLGATKYATISSDGATTNSGAWNDTSPTSSVFTTGSFFNTNSMVAYCWAEVPGFSKFGSYVGNGSTNGPFVYCGFRPKFILTKDISTSSYWWEMVDSSRSPYNPSNKTLYANSGDGEYTSSGYDKDLLSNGFKIRGTNGGHNTSASTYIFAAFAESPFKYSRAR
jgi:hypothetical protein